MKCSRCKEEIKGKSVEMGAYGLNFHPGCFVTATGPQIVAFMGDDETIVRTPGNPECERVRDARNINFDGSVRGEQELVNW